MSAFISQKHIFSTNDLTGTFSGLTVGNVADPDIFLDTKEDVVEAYIDKDGNALYGIDNEFGFDVTDFIGAEQKELNGDYAEGFAGNIYDEDDNITGMSVYNAETDIFRSGAPLGTWSLGLGGSTVKASTEHYVTMSDLLSDQIVPGDTGAIRPLDNDLKMLDLRPVGTGVFEVGALHEKYVRELSEALQKAIDNPLLLQTFADIDFDRDGTDDTYSTVETEVQADIDDDGFVETIRVGGVDLDGDGEADLVDSFLNGFGANADIVDLLEPNESSVTYDIAYGQDYSVTLKDDGKLLYRWGEAIKRPNDIRMEIDLDLPDEWTSDENENGVADGLEGNGFVVTRAELVITHDITNNPNDQVRPEDYENEAAIGRLPSYYVVQDPMSATPNELWVSPVDTYNGEGTFLPSYFKLDSNGNIDMLAGGLGVFDPGGTLIGYLNVDENDQPIGTVLRDMSLAIDPADPVLDFTTKDLEEGFTPEWYTTTDREPFEWSYDKFPNNEYANVYESFRSPEEAASAGYDKEDLVSGPRWRLTPNKFGQDLPGLEVPLVPNSAPPFQKDNIKYDTGTLTTTTLNLLDWAGDSPLATSLGWMAIDADRLDENKDGLIDAGWKDVNGSLNAGDEVPDGPVLSAVTPNGVTLDALAFDTAIYVKGDRQDSAKLYDMQLIIEYDTDIPVAESTIGTVQMVSGLNHNPQTVNFEGGNSFSNSVVFATTTTKNGPHPVTVEFSEITSTGATLYLEEPDAYDGTHLNEDVSLVTFEAGVWSLADNSLLQVGTTVFEAGATNEFHTVTFDVEFDEAPIILLQTQTDNDSQWEVVRAQNVTTTGFEYAIQEQEASDGVHGSEVIGWAALDAANPDGIVDWTSMLGQAFNTGSVIDYTADEFEFVSDVGAAPLVAAAMSTFNGSDTANLRMAGVVDNGIAATASFFIQEEVSLDQEVFHVLENVTGMAFEESGVLMGDAYVSDALLFL